MNVRIVQHPAIVFGHLRHRNSLILFASPGHRQRRRRLHILISKLDFLAVSLRIDRHVALFCVVAGQSFIVWQNVLIEVLLLHPFVAGCGTPPRHGDLALQMRGEARLSPRCVLFEIAEFIQVICIFAVEMLLILWLPICGQH